tara:strand:+ start:8515 stop:8685 length:171 start_codon:yes stop_codon:yes gene_type:complete
MYAVSFSLLINQFRLRLLERKVVKSKEREDKSLSELTVKNPNHKVDYEYFKANSAI